VSSPYDDDEPVFPDQTSDDDPRSWGERDSDEDDERILREVPPHHE